MDRILQGSIPTVCQLTARNCIRSTSTSPPDPDRRISHTPRSDPFSLVDPAVTEAILAAGGFAEVSFTDVHEPVYYGPDSATAFDAVLRLLRNSKTCLPTSTPRPEQAGTRLRTTLDAHNTDGGVYFGSRAWIITARRH
jgi:hypothetical protein